MHPFEIIQVDSSATPYPGILLEVGRRSPGTLYIHGVELSTVPTVAPAVFTLHDARSRTTQRWNITFSGNPADGETVTHTCAPGAFTRVFEFDNNGTVTANRIGVQIGANAFETAKNLVVALERAVPGNGVFTDRTVGAPVVKWETFIPGNTTQLPNLFTEASGVIAVAVDGAFASGAAIDLLHATHSVLFRTPLATGIFIPIGLHVSEGALLNLTQTPAIANVHYRYRGARRLFGRAMPRTVGEQLA